MGEGLLTTAGVSTLSARFLSFLLGLEVQGCDEPPLLTLGLPSAWAVCRL